MKNCKRIREKIGSSKILFTQFRNYNLIQQYKHLDPGQISQVEHFIRFLCTMWSGWASIYGLFIFKAINM